VVTLDMRRGGTPAPLSNVGSHFVAEGNLGAQPARWTPVLGRATYPAPWQAWRIEVPPASQAQPFALSIGTALPANPEWRYRAYFVPR